ncbi:hypothetical protein BT93_G0305 [Corymbia citriodora subsp. variegata]|nr:hypothetical protein BT93_G0305 [Corymbia citriodora subsp. variegata]
MKVEVQWKKLVRPSAPTPKNQQKWKLTSIDKLHPPIYMGIIFYYGDNAEKPSVDIRERLHQMEESLSKTLTLFYPMAGRYSEDDSCVIDCNDLGVEFIHAKVDGQIDQVLHGEPDMDLLDRLSEFPTNVVGNPLVVIQVNMFEGGGLVIGLRFTHKIGDLYTMAMFITSWAAACRGDTDATVYPSFHLSSLFPVKESVAHNLPPPRIGNEEFVLSRFRFSGNSLLKLKALARDDANDLMRNDSQPSRVEVVSALISRALVDIDRKKHGEQSTSVICMTLHLREKMNLAIPANSCGNLYAMMFARPDQNTATKSKLNFNGMVNVMRGMISDAKIKYSTVADREEFCSMAGDSLTKFTTMVSASEECLIPFTSWCRFGLYENDFGWGKPILISSTSPKFRSMILIEDEESGGINAWITLDKDEMILLKQDPEILAFTS